MLLAGIATAQTPPSAATHPAPLANPVPQSRCLQDAAYSRLDFWLGSWNVVDDSGAVAGSAVIRKILGGCAIQYEWHDPDGSETLEIFYYVPASKQWRQVLISDSGRTMERKLNDHGSPPGSIRFEGTADRMSGGTYSDRSTVTAVNGQQVHQLIERSLDGKEWQITFDARYNRQR